MKFQRPLSALVSLRISALVLAIPAVFTVGAETALASCTQAGTIVNCTAPGTGGIVVAGDNAVVTVRAGTTVVDDGTRAIEINNSSTVTNNGTVRAVTNNSQGILTNAVAGDNNTIVNNGTITSEGDQAQGAALNGSGNTFANSATGIITQSGAFGSGIASGGDNTIINAGTITVAGASDAGSSTFAVGVSLNLDDVMVNSGTVTITAQVLDRYLYARLDQQHHKLRNNQRQRGRSYGHFCPERHGVFEHRHDQRCRHRRKRRRVSHQRYGNIHQ